MASRFWVGGTATWDGSTTTNWAATTGGAGGQSVPGAGDTVTFDGASGGGTVTVNTTVNVTSLTMGAFTGTLDFSVNNNAVTLGSFSGTGTGTRTLNMGNGTWTLTNTNGNIWDITTATNLTLNSNSSTITLSTSITVVAARTMLLGGKTYSTISLVPPAGGKGFALLLSGAAPTIATLNITAPMFVRLPNGVTTTISNAVTWAGTSNSNSIIISSDSGNAGATVAFTASSTLNWTAINNLTATGSPAATNSFDLQGNSGFTITGPSGGTRMIGG